jgi:inhibitor of KinA
MAEGMDTIAAALKDGHPGDTVLKRTIEIPVCYEDEFGPDLGRVLKHTGYDKEELIERHTSGRYLVYFLGFSAGFPYIGGMDESLATPRLKTPRKAVPAGSVGIAGQQTGIYPLSTPGGWNLIGRTPLHLFNRSNPKDTAIRMGDRIRFRTVGRAEFESLGQSQS